MNVDISQFLAAVIDAAGGKIDIAYDTFVAQTGEKAITIDLVEDGKIIRLGLVDTTDVEFEDE